MKTTMIRASLAVLFLALAGCVVPEEPSEARRAPKEEAPAATLEITLVREVTVEKASKTVGAYSMTREVDAVGRSKFGQPGEIADLGCILDGLRARAPAVEVVPTARFWKEVAAPDAAVSLLRLFRTDKAARLEALEVDYLVAAYHQRFDVKAGGGELVIAGSYVDEDREVAATAVIDARRGTVLNAAQFVYESSLAVGHALFFVPLVMGNYAASDPCAMSGEAAAAAIAEATDRSAPRVIVVAAKDNPYAALGRRGRQEELLALYDCAERPEGCRDVDLDLLYTRAHQKGPLEGWPLYCLAAHFGHAKARMTLANYYRQGTVPVAKDRIEAAVWYRLAARDGLSWAGTSLRGLEKEMSAAERAEAARRAAGWTPNPGACRLTG